MSPATDKVHFRYPSGFEQRKSPIMKYSKNRNRKIRLLLSALFFLLFSECQPGHSDLDLSMYQYRDTRDLVRFVYDAARVLQKKGLSSIDYFRNNRSLYKQKNYYLYVYSLDGTNLFHAGMPELEGRNLLLATDKNGKMITGMILRAIENPVNPHGWVHYTWWEPGKFYPVPKSSCHFKVITPEGKELFVGGGIDYPQEEKEFIRIVVDDAVSSFERKGMAAVNEIADPTSEYNYREVRVFAFQSDGSMLISPVMNERFQKMSIVGCVDEVGHKPFDKALKRLEQRESVWEVFLAKSRFKRGLIKKCLYLRKTMLEDSVVYVGAVTDLPEPP
ncbi:MAG: cache domain-containing protein [Chlorobium sp.]|nr:cache domain-containing protein [Chlorobium sp.]